VADDLVRRAADRLAGLDCRIRFMAGYSTLPGSGGRMDLPKRLTSAFARCPAR